MMGPKLIVTRKIYEYNSVELMDRHIVKMCQQGYEVTNKSTTKMGKFRVEYFK